MAEPRVRGVGDEPPIEEVVELAADVRRGLGRYAGRGLVQSGNDRPAEIEGLGDRPEDALGGLDQARAARLPARAVGSLGAHCPGRLEEAARDGRLDDVPGQPRRRGPPRAPGRRPHGEAGSRA